MAVISGASGGNASSVIVNPEIQKENIESMERIIMDISKTMTQIDATINDLIANGLVGPAIETFVNGYANNREEIGKYVKTVSVMTLDLTSFVNTSIRNDEQASAAIQLK